VTENKRNLNESVINKAEEVVEKEMDTVGKMVPELAITDEIANITISVVKEGNSIYELIETNLDKTL
jgi:hypothetical protein